MVWSCVHAHGTIAAMSMHDLIDLVFMDRVAMHASEGSKCHIATAKRRETPVYGVVNN